MSPEAEAARRRWIVTTQQFWAGAATNTQLRDAEEAYLSALEGPLGQGADA